MVGDILGVVLAGGRSSRFGSNKAFARFRGEEMISHVLNEMSAVFSNVAIVTNTPSEYENLGFRVIKDAIPNRGPLGGIVTALEFADKIFVCACDMPFVNKDAIEFIIREGAEPLPYDVGATLCGRPNAIVARTSFGIEPLFAVYKKPAQRYFEKALRDKKGSVRDVLNEMTEVAYIDIDKKTLSSINTIEELNAAVSL